MASGATNYMKYKKEISAGGIVYKKLKPARPAGGSKIVNRKSEVVWLITKHSQHKGWGFPKGIVGDADEKEAMEDAALREVREEGGVKAKIVHNTAIEVKYKYRLKEYLVDKTVYYFLMEYVSGDPKDHDWEVEEAKFVKTDEVRKTVTFSSDQKAFEKGLKKLRSLS